VFLGLTMMMNANDHDHDDDGQLAQMMQDDNDK
jgi:hypothetical protein